jgi:pimeloyl-ACP methyl ester carboxylesterase
VGLGCGAGLTVVGILKMMEDYKIDPSRVYVAGHGEGGRMASRVAFQHPELVRGCIPCSGAEFYKAVKWGGSGYGIFSHSADMVGAAKRNVRFALITGETDVHRDEILDLYYGGFTKDAFQAKLFDVPNSPQGTFSANVLGHAIEFLENGRKIQ